MSNPNLAQAREKALKSPRHGKHGKNKKTLQKEAALKFLADSFLKDFDPITKKHLAKARKGDHASWVEFMNRVFGKVKDKSEVKITLPEPILKNIIKKDEETNNS